MYFPEVNKFVNKLRSSCFISEIFNLVTERHNFHSKHRLFLPKVQSVKYGPFGLLLFETDSRKNTRKQILLPLNVVNKYWKGLECHYLIYMNIEGIYIYIYTCILHYYITLMLCVKHMA